MKHHTPGIVWKKGLSKQDYYVWCHTHCFSNMAKEVNKWIKHNTDLIEKVKINSIAKQV